MLASISRSMNRKVSHQFQCQICLNKAKEVPELYVAPCQHKQSFCESCMHEYTIYLVSQFQEVTCPNSQCDTLIDTNGKFFKELPLDIQKKYTKLHNFYLTLNDSSIKMCPREECDGILKKDSEQAQTMTCSLCQVKFCGKCLMKEHSGDCDDYQVEFLLKNHKYKRCKKCKMVIEKNQGCNQITCKCGNQFCYVCGADWTPPHYHDHD